MTAIFEDRALAGKAAKKLRVYAQPQRLMILSCLLRGERCTFSRAAEPTGAR